MDTQQEKQNVANLSTELTDKVAEFFRTLDDLHGTIVRANKLQKDLTQAGKNVSSMPSESYLQWYELSKSIQTIFAHEYRSMDDSTQADLAGRGITLRDWTSEFLGKPIVR